MSPGGGLFVVSIGKKDKYRIFWQRLCDRGTYPGLTLSEIL